MKIKLQQAITKLDEVRDGAIDLAKVNFKVAVEEFKKSLDLQKYLNSYGMGSFNITCDDMRRYFIG